MSPEYYTSVVECVRKAKDKWCDDNCSECPFNTNPFCLLNVLESEFEEYAEDNRKIIKKRFIDLTELEIALDQYYHRYDKVETRRVEENE